MCQTIVEKILAAHADRDVVRPGEFVSAGVDLVLANDITGPPTIAQFRRMGATRVFDPDHVALVPDHFTPPKDVYAAALISALRAFAREQNIPHYWEMGEVGIEHTILPEEGLVRPWMIIVGGDSHTCTYGASGAFGSGLGSTDVAAVLALGETWDETRPAEPFPPLLKRLIAAGGLGPYVRERLAGEHGPDLR